LDTQNDTQSNSLNNRLECLLFLENRLIEDKKLANKLDVAIDEIRAAVLLLNQKYRECGSIFNINSIANSFQLALNPDFRDPLLQQYTDKKKKLSKAVLETLGIIAYKQPLTRPEVDAVRGVNCAGYIKELLDDDFIKIAGKKDAPGKPTLYRTTNKFLIHFGLSTLTDLPTLKEIKSYEFLNIDAEEYLSAKKQATKEVDPEKASAEENPA